MKNCHPKGEIGMILLTVRQTEFHALICKVIDCFDEPFYHFWNCNSGCLSMINNEIYFYRLVPISASDCVGFRMIKDDT